MSKLANQENQLKELRPKKEIKEGTKMSTLKMKDKFFNKEKTFIDKSSGTAKVIPADWRKLHIGRMKILAFKGEVLTAEEAAAFDDKAKAYYLESVKPKSKTKSKKEETK